MIGSQAVTGRGSKVALALAVVMGLVAALMVYLALKEAGKTSPTTATAEQVPVVVAARAIAARTRITADMLEVVMAPKGLVVEGAFSDPQAVVGKVARFPIAAKEQISQHELAETALQAADDQTSLSIVVPPGKRAVAIKVEEATAVGGLVLPGDFVDVVGVFAVEDAAGNKRFVSLVVAQNAQVLAVGQEVADLPPDASRLPPEERVNLGGGKPQPEAKTVTLALDPQQALAVSLAADMGTLHLALRPFSETETTPVPPLPADVPLPPELAAIAAMTR